MDNKSHIFRSEISHFFVTFEAMERAQKSLSFINCNANAHGHKWIRLMDWLHFFSRSSFEFLHCWHFNRFVCVCVFRCKEKSTRNCIHYACVCIWMLAGLQWWRALKVFHFQWVTSHLSYSPACQKMCDAFHMWIDRHRESLCSIYSFHSQAITKTHFSASALPKWSHTGVHSFTCK